MEKMCHHYILILEGGFAPDEWNSNFLLPTIPRETTLVLLKTRRDVVIKAFLIITMHKIGK